MSEEEVQRFPVFHRVMHWLVAIPYIVLLVSGAMILLRHLGWIAVPSLAGLAKLHRWLGIGFIALVLQIVFAALVGGYWRSVGRDLGSWFHWRPSDVAWLLCAPLNSCFPRRFAMPPAGRFNAGQKLHGIYILVAVTGLSVTGLIMILVPGWLTVWRVHVLLFAGAAGFLCIHLFLGLINPSTRRALSGIFSGKVSRDYISEHHALEGDGAGHEARPHATVSLAAVAITAAIVGTIAFAWWREAGRAKVAATFHGPWTTTVLLPGPLNSVHSQQIAADRCGVCHTGSGPVTNQACLACHKEIGQSLQQKLGYHGTLSGNCTQCHVEHHGANADLRVFDHRAFNHNQARFQLVGQHMALQCDECHLKHSPTPGETRFIGLQFSSCNNCHSNPHADMPTVECRSCHSALGWTGRNLLFDHNRDSRFKLDAVHATLSCASCHKPAQPVAVFRGTPATCSQCHAPLADAMAGKIGSAVTAADPHNGRVACNECHLADARAQTPSQYASQCVRCHNEQYRQLFFNWQKSLDEHEQAAKTRMSTQAAANAAQQKEWSDLLNRARVAGMHNTQGAAAVLDQVGR